MTPVEFRGDLWHQKTRVPGVSCGVVCVILHFADLVELRLVTDSQRPMASTADAYHRAVKTNWDFTKARASEWQWHPLGHMQVCTSLQPDNHASTPPLSFFTGRMPFLPPNQQHQSTEGRQCKEKKVLDMK